ncbi:NUDIX domain-containing protein [Candidatus Woesearchaeota archaeon]|nr:MAG: NUDIX domain-containing protein [Candidatus Woesearchaeota archaeon]
MADLVRRGWFEAVKFVFMDGNGDVLLEKRSSSKAIFPGITAFPAGHVDTLDADALPENPALHALKRESVEELGIVPKIAVFLGKTSLRLETPEFRRYGLSYYLCKGFDRHSVPAVSMENPPAKLLWKPFKAVRSVLGIPQDGEILSFLPRKQPVICVSGTPGTGKTTLAKTLSERLNLAYLGISETVRRHKLYDSFDGKYGSYIVSVPRLKRFIRSELEKKPFGWVIDGHMSHFLPKSLVDVCIICRTDLKILNSRLQSRKYPPEKIRENLDSEIFDVCGQEALSFGHRVLYLNTSSSSREFLFQEFMRFLKQGHTPLLPVEAIDSFQKP